MITKVDSSNFEKYSKLFQDAENLLCGFKDVKTFDYDYINDGGFYYVKESRGVFKALASEFEEDGSPKAGTSLITDLQSFAAELGTYKDVGGIFKRILTDEQVRDNGYAPSNGITTLEEYFSWLGVIKNIDEDFSNKYIELPLDEPHFTIDANTRAITIPADFRKNGISVQGDNLAEVVYFEIDRFYDYMDFNNCEIYIQWEAPKATTPTVSTAYNKAIYHDTENDRDILVFGWAISDVLTAQTGNLKFSVIFYQIDEEEGKVAYRFNTLTATASIKASMTLDLLNDKFEIDDVGSRLKDRISNSTVVGGYEAKYPEFIINLEDREYDLPEDGELAVQASVSDTGAISYLWSKVPYGTDGELDFSGKISGLTGESKYTPVEGDYTSSAVLNPKFTYYVHKTDGHYIEMSAAKFSKPMTEANLTTFNDPSNGYDGKVYQYVSTYKVETVGLYQAQATNRLTAAAATTESVSALFPCPEKAKNAVLAFGEGQTGILEGEDSITLKASGDIANKNAVSYTWYRSENSVEGVTPTWVEAVKDETTGEYTATDKGYYKVDINTTRNNISTSVQATTKDNQGYLRVTGPAIAAEISLSNPLEIDQEELSADNCFAFTIGNDLPENRDNYLVDWYVFQEDINAKIEKKDEEGNVVITASKKYGDDGFYKFNPADYADLIKELTKDDNIIAYYYPVVTTVLNGDEKQSKPDGKFEVTYTPVEVATLDLDEEDTDTNRVTLDNSKLFFEAED